MSLKRSRIVFSGEAHGRVTVAPNRSARAFNFLVHYPARSVAEMIEAVLQDHGLGWDPVRASHVPRFHQIESCPRPNYGDSIFNCLTAVRLYPHTQHQLNILSP